MKEQEIRPSDLFDEFLRRCDEDVQTFFSDASSFVDARCPGCGEDRYEPAFVKGGFRYVTCSSCATLYVRPRPSPEAIAEYYRNGVSVSFWASHFFRETESARRAAIFRPRAALIADLASEHLHGTSPPSFADIGAGYGVLLEEIASTGAFQSMTAIEPSPALASVCREKGFLVVEKALEDIGPGELEVDFATSFEVLEHLFNPLAFLQHARSILRSGGILLFTTLTVDGFDIQVLWDRSKSVYPPHHLNFLSKAGFQALLERAGFETLSISTPGRLDVDIVQNACRDFPDVEIPRFVGSLLAAGEPTRSAFQHFLSTNGLSSHGQVIARAP